MKVGFIGLGTMGRHMAANLQKAGHELVAPLHQVGRHVASHRAQADEPDFHGFLASNTLRAIVPAVMAAGQPA